MRWEDYRRSDEVEDRRGSPGGLPGGIQLPIGGRGIGLGGMIIIGIISLLLGVNPLEILGKLGGPGGQVQIPTQQSPRGPSAPAPNAANDQVGEFAKAVLAQSEDTWGEIFKQLGRTYERPRLVLFSRATQSGCGFAQSAMGPFYCPNDRKVYIDLSFFNEMRTKFRVNGDFAYAYVITHEVGHHIQNLIGILPRVQQAQQQMSEREANALQVRVELQADCFAGVWAKRTDQRARILEQGEVKEALEAAAAIGDDRLQRQSQGYVVPDSFTHGTSEQRMRWFMTGFQTGDMNACNTFNARQL